MRFRATLSDGSVRVATDVGRFELWIQDGTIDENTIFTDEDGKLHRAGELPFLVDAFQKKKFGVKEKKCPFCAETIKAEAVFCRFCKKSLSGSSPSALPKDTKTTNGNPIGAIFAVLCLLGGGWFYLPQWLSPVAGSLPTAQNVISLDEFSRIQDGMSLSEIEDIIGSPGTQTSSTTIGDIKSEMYSWQNPDGSNSIISFTNDKCNMKSQFGLK